MARAVGLLVYIRCVLLGGRSRVLVMKCLRDGSSHSL